MNRPSWRSSWGEPAILLILFLFLSAQEEEEEEEDEKEDELDSGGLFRGVEV
jgi:hypothetical protein